MSKRISWQMREKDRIRGAKYDSFRDFDSYPIRYASGLIIKNKAGRTFLELGCGEGLMTKQLAKNFKVVAVDAWEEGIKKLKKNLGTRVETYTCLFEDFVTDKKFSDIVISHVLEHVKNPIFLLKKFKSFLASKGRIHIVAPNGNSLHRHVGVELGTLKRPTGFTQKDKEAGHRRVYTKKSLENDIKKAGLKVIHSEGILVKPLSSSQMLKLSPEIIWAFVKLGKKFPEIAGEIYFVCKKS